MKNLRSGKLMFAALMIMSCLLSVTPPLHGPNAYSMTGTLNRAEAGNAPGSSYTATVFQRRAAPLSFDPDSYQPESVYDPSRDERAPVLNVDPKRNEELIKAVTDANTLRVREQPIGSDWGPEIKDYLEFCGIQRPAWWCAAFVSYQIHRAGETSGVASRWPRFANCVDIYNWGSRHNVLTEEPTVPCVMLIPGNVARGERRYKHTGIVVGYNRNTRTIDTVEGNSNNNGSRNGIGVFRLRRRVIRGMAFVKIV